MTSTARTTIAPGSFGHHVAELELLRSDGQRIVCGPNVNPEWFPATVGGLGLTGLITRVDLVLAPILNPFMIVEAKRFRSLEEFWEMNADRRAGWPYTAAWIDCLAKAGRGLQLAARHAAAAVEIPTRREQRRSVPIDPPVSLINPLSLRAFNALYYRQPLPRAPEAQHYARYLYPLDSIENWNRMYGRRGFYQYQCVLPPETCARGGRRTCCGIIARHGAGSFLAVLKTFGDTASLGMMSFRAARRDAGVGFPQPAARRPGAFERPRRRHARRRRRALSGQGCAHVGCDVPRRLSQLGQIFRLRRSEILFRVLAAGHGQSRMSKIVIFGANSAIAAAPARQWIARRRQPVPGRPQPQQAAGDRRRPRRAQGPRPDRRQRELPISTILLSMRRLIDAARAALGGIDVVLIAYGSLPDQEACAASVDDDDRRKSRPTR